MTLHRSLLSATALLLMCSTGLGRQQLQAMRADKPLKDAGVYHVATGTWSRARGGPGANVGPDIIYRADVPSGHFAMGLEDVEVVDEGILPGTGNQDHPGPLDEYCINCFTFAYCSDSAAPVEWWFSFYESYFPCDDPDMPANCIKENAAFHITGLPAGGFCWTVTIDLTGGSEFLMAADGGACNPGWQGAATGLDHFGWGSKWVTQDGAPTGPLLWGYDPNWAPFGEGTCYDPPLTCPAGASALGAADLVGVGDPLNVCTFFGGYNNPHACGGPIVVPGAQFAMILYTDCSSSECAPDACDIIVYCDPGPAITPNVTDLVIDNCLCADGRGVFTITDTGFVSSGSGFGYMLQSMTQAQIQNPPGAHGTLCVAGSTLCRYSQDIFLLPTGGSVVSDLTNPNTGCTDPCAVPGQTWNWQAWHRAKLPQMTSRFSNALTVTYQ